MSFKLLSSAFFLELWRLKTKNKKFPSIQTKPSYENSVPFLPLAPRNQDTPVWLWNYFLHKHRDVENVGRVPAPGRFRGPKIWQSKGQCHPTPPGCHPPKEKKALLRKYSPPPLRKLALGGVILRFPWSNILMNPAFILMPHPLLRAPTKITTSPGKEKLTPNLFFTMFTSFFLGENPIRKKESPEKKKR